MANHNKDKGKRLERELARELTEAFGLNFERIWSSGAFTGGKNASRLNKLTREQALLSIGDILVPIELEHIQIEAKFYRAFSFHSIYENNEVLNNWIQQAKGSSNKVWFLIFKINNMGKYLVFDKKYESKFKPIETRMIYKDNYIICKYGNFFKDNKDALLLLTP